VNAVNFSQAGFTVSFGGAETLAPPNAVVRGAPASLTVGVTPAHPTNAVDVVYRVDDGLAQTLSAWEVRTDHVANIQYFRAHFPRFAHGKRVDYCPVAHCAGGVQVPAPGHERELMATFALVDAPRRQAEPTRQPQFRAELSHLASGRLELEPPCVFGDTPEGFRAAFHVAGGSMHGERLAGAIEADSLIELRVRSDGIGTVEMHLTARTERGALASLTLHGKIDFGPSSSDRFVLEDGATGRFETMATLETGARDLEWLNRASVLAVGCFDMGQRAVTCDLLHTKTARVT